MLYRSEALVSGLFRKGARFFIFGSPLTLSRCMTISD